MRYLLLVVAFDASLYSMAYFLFQWPWLFMPFYAGLLFCGALLARRYERMFLNRFRSNPAIGQAQAIEKWVRLVGGERRKCGKQD